MLLAVLELSDLPGEEAWESRVLCLLSKDHASEIACYLQKQEDYSFFHFLAIKFTDLLLTWLKIQGYLNDENKSIKVTLNF